MPEARVELHVVAAAHGVDRTDTGRDRAELRLGRPQSALEPGVDAFAVRALAALVGVGAADVRDLRVGEAADEQSEGVGRPERVRV